MPLDMDADLRFPMGASIALENNAILDFLKLARKIKTSENSQYVIETFKEHFARASGRSYSKSSNLSWAESDLDQYASEAGKDAPGFIQAICDACVHLELYEIHTPTHANINLVLEKNQVPLRIQNNFICTSSNYLTPPAPTASAVSIVERALSDAKALLGHTNASSAVDRAHTALHGYLISLCAQESIILNDDITSSKAFKLLREHHPALSAEGHRASEVTRVLQSFAASIDAFSTLRNKASLAHANELLDEPEATFIVNSIYTVFRYIQDRLERYARSDT